MILVAVLLGTFLPSASPALAYGPSGPAAEAGVYVALGDSYAAGEGLDDYEASTDIPKNPGHNMCHRSLTGAYSMIDPAGTMSRPIVLPEVTSRSFWACSGATSGDVLAVGGHIPGQPGLRQAGQPDQTTTPGPETRYITLTAGGDDAYFGDLGMACVEGIVAHRVVVHPPSKYSCTAQLKLSNNAISSTAKGSMRANLKTIYTKVLKSAPKAVLNVTGYPRVFPATYAGLPKLKGASFCILDHYPWNPVTGFRATVDVGTPESTAKLIDAFEVGLNQAIHDTVNDIRRAQPADAARILYTDTYTPATPRNCKGTTPNASVTGFELSLAGQGTGGNFMKLFISSATFHPTKAGQQMMAAAVQAGFDSARPRISLAPPTAMVGTPYTFALSTLDGRAGTWTYGPDPLPPGLDLLGWIVSGTPTTAGQWNVPIAFTDVHGFTAATTLTFVVQDPAAITPLKIYSMAGTAKDGVVTILTHASSPAGFSPFAGSYPEGFSSVALNFMCNFPDGSRAGSLGTAVATEQLISGTIYDGTFSSTYDLKTFGGWPQAWSSSILSCHVLQASVYIEGGGADPGQHVDYGDSNNYSSDPFGVDFTLPN